MLKNLNDFLCIDVYYLLNCDSLRRKCFFKVVVSGQFKFVNGKQNEDHGWKVPIQTNDSIPFIIYDDNRQELLKTNIVKRMSNHARGFYAYVVHYYKSIEDISYLFS